MLGFFIERSNLAYSNKKLLSDRETVLYPILLWLDNAVCGFISYLDQIGNEFEVETVKEFFGVFEELRRKEVLDEYSFIKQIDESDYLHEVKGWFLESPLAISAIKDISFNRSYVLRNNLFSDNEIRNLNLICVLISNVQCSESAREIHAKLLNIFLYMNLPEILNIQIRKDAAGLAFSMTIERFSW